MTCELKAKEKLIHTEAEKDCGSIAQFKTKS